MAAKNPYIKRPGTFLNWLTLTTPLLTVSVTDAPRKKAPRNSQKPAIMTACHIFMALVPTDEPNELARSLAPMPKATKKATMMERTKIHVYSE